MSDIAFSNYLIEQANDELMSEVHCLKLLSKTNGIFYSAL